MQSYLFQRNYRPEDGEMIFLRWMILLIPRSDDSEIDFERTSTPPRQLERGRDVIPLVCENKRCWRWIIDDEQSITADLGASKTTKANSWRGVQIESVFVKLAFEIALRDRLAF
ncbi:hypothetical protein K443DRAFT_628487 [Laccaria amethystina LaAM-08-1]|uniref:Uncharacterized protein n=1 Tax=Laccaria amethystina LaAM-08-1 TaxID=1095629 RepID=A0A0C9YA34_9AGAR|nr:hypothetical protein K443DRAFT_628487 [Laccaria amethystina LaAM-08-1]